LFYRELEKLKIISLKLNKGDFNKFITLSDEAKFELKWWIDNIRHTFTKLERIPFDKVIFTDASNAGWEYLQKVSRMGAGGTNNKICILMH